MLSKEQVQKAKRETEQLRVGKWLNICCALSDANRLKTLWLLLRYGELCPTEIAQILGMSLSAASHQGRLLKMNGLVETKRMGKMICYKLNRDNHQVKLIEKILKIL